jgi:preprotein translocase subunit SecD
MLIVILIITSLAIWIDLPGDTWDIGGFKADRPVRRGLDLQGGLQVQLQARPPDGQEVDEETLNGTRDTLERRVNGLGVSEPLIQTRGDDQIVVELPGIENPEEAVAILRETAQLEVIDTGGVQLAPGTVVNTTLGNASESTAANPNTSPTASPVASPIASPIAESAAPTPPSDAPVYQTIISGDDLRDAYPSRDPITGQTVMAFQLNSDAAGTFYDYTSTHIGQPISFVIDKQVISSPTLQGAISNEGVINGVTPEEAQQLAIQLKAGALAVPLDVVSSRTVGPTLGEDSIDRSLVAGTVGLTMVALFMILYYRVPGVVSVLALVIYTLLTFALFKLIPVTLTLAGIAGFILSIGMAVDANVLIFARLREEIRTGKSLSAAIEAGFDHAWPSIRDSNTSTMITCVILYWFGRYTGATIITGFALTLFIGVAVSMFTAITVTRTFLRLMVDAGFIRGSRWLGADRAELTPATTGD